MGKGKPRENPNKEQNNYGGSYDCVNFDKNYKGEEWCHDEGQTWFGEYIKWAKVEDGKLKCNGNRHNCMKLRQQWIASLSEKEKEKILKHS